MDSHVQDSRSPDGEQPGVSFLRPGRVAEKQSVDAGQDYRALPAQSSASLPWLDVRGAAARAGISEGYACTLMTSGAICSVKVGRLRRTRPEWVDAWLLSGGGA
jgi:hypothetical protein